MTDFLAFWSHPTTLVFLIGSAALLVMWRLSNAEVALKWSARTKAIEPAERSLAALQTERDEYKAAAAHLQAEVKAMREGKP